MATESNTNNSNKEHDDGDGDDDGHPITGRRKTGTFKPTKNKWFTSDPLRNSKLDRMFSSSNLKNLKNAVKKIGNRNSILEDAEEKESEKEDSDASSSSDASNDPWNQSKFYNTLTAQDVSRNSALSTRLQRQISETVSGGFRARHKENLSNRLTRTDSVTVRGFATTGASASAGAGAGDTTTGNTGDIGTSGNKSSTTFSKRWLRIRYECGLLINNTAVQQCIMIMIILNALTMGMSTFVKEGDDDTNQIFKNIDTVFLVVYTVEILMQFIYFGPRLIQDNWLAFDLFIVLTSWIGDYVQTFQNFQMLRAFRIFRAIRSLTKIRVLRDLVAAIGEVIPNLIGVMMLTLLLFYIFAVLFTELYRDLHMEGEENEYPFVSLHLSFITLLEIMTLEWVSYARKAMEKNPYAWIPFVVFILLTGFIMTNLIIAVICDAVSLVDHVAREREALKNGGIDLELTTEQQLTFCKASIFRINERIQVIQQSQKNFQDLMEFVASELVEDLRLSGSGIELLLLPESENDVVDDNDDDDDEDASMDTFYTAGDNDDNNNNNKKKKASTRSTSSSSICSSISQSNNTDASLNSIPEEGIQQQQQKQQRLHTISLNNTKNLISEEEEEE